MPSLQVKALKPMEEMDMAMKAFKWWNAADPPAGMHWTTLEHCGVLFPPAYVPHGVMMTYDGAPVELTPPQEELATFFASEFLAPNWCTVPTACLYVSLPLSVSLGLPPFPYSTAVPVDGPQLGDEKVRPTFITNFFKDFKAALGPGHVIKVFEKCDFGVSCRGRQGRVWEGGCLLLL
jgi:DNA topoisomerase I